MKKEHSVLTYIWSIYDAFQHHCYPPPPPLLQVVHVTCAVMGIVFSALERNYWIVIVIVECESNYWH